MAKERRARLAPRPAPDATATATAAESSAAPAAQPSAIRTRRDVRSSEHVAALYARVPAGTKRRLDIATAMSGRSLSDVVTALLDAHVDPTDPVKQSALEQLLKR
jgi:hypothetical protein